jgi:hypothetical protein
MDNQKVNFEINPNLNQLSGPVSWTEFLFEDDQGNKKMIHLFGDFHDKENLCPSSDLCASNSSQKDHLCYTFPFFLEQLFEEVQMKNQTADFFMEVPYHLEDREYIDPERNKSEDSLLEEIYEKFRPCFQRNKSKCQYDPNNVRMHYTDLRIAFQDKKTMKELEKSSYGLLGPFLNQQLNEWITVIGTFFESQITQKKFTDISIKTLIFNQLIQNGLNLYIDIIAILLTSSKGKQDLVSKINQIKDLFKDPKFNVHKDKLFQTLDNLPLLFKSDSQSILKKQLDALHQDKIYYRGKSMSEYISNYAMELINVLTTNNIPKIQSIWNELFEIFKRWIKSLSNLTKNLTFDNQNLFNHINIEIINKYNQVERKLQTFLVYLDFFVLDLYILTRMFRNFGKKQSLLSITYAGQDHIGVQSEFFKSIGVKMIREIPFDYRKPNFQCLKDKDLGKAFTITKNNI